MDATTIAIASALIWIGNHTEYNIHIPWPTVEYVDEVTMEKRLGVDSSSASKDEYTPVVGLYTKRKSLVSLVKGTGIRTLEGKSALFHEIFHHVQNLNRDKAPRLQNDCEKEAYGFENRWRKEHHLKPAYVPDLSIGDEKC